LLSNRWPARIAISRGAAGHCSTPPSEPTHGVGPAPRHGADGACPCAQSDAAHRKNPLAASMKIRLIAEPPGEISDWF
jgi:hypothetical protein